MIEKPKLIIADDDPGIRNVVRNVAEGLGYEVGEAATGKQYLDHYGDTFAEVIILDIVMPEEHGLGLFDFIHENHQKSKIFIITGRGENFLDAAMKIAEKKGVNVVGGFNKPIKLDKFEKLLKDALPLSK